MKAMEAILTGLKILEGGYRREAARAASNNYYSSFVCDFSFVASGTMVNISSRFRRLCDPGKVSLHTRPQVHVNRLSIVVNSMLRKMAITIKYTESRIQCTSI